MNDKLVISIMGQRFNLRPGDKFKIESEAGPCCTITRPIDYTHWCPNKSVFQCVSEYWEKEVRAHLKKQLSPLYLFPGEDTPLMKFTREMSPVELDPPEFKMFFGVNYVAIKPKQKGNKMSKKARIKELEREAKMLRGTVTRLHDRVGVLSNTINSRTGLRHRVYELEEDSCRTNDILEEAKRRVQSNYGFVSRQYHSTEIGSLQITLNSLAGQVDAICDFLNIEIVTQEAQPSKTVAVSSEKDKNPKKEGK